jgi:hypothetical protein
VASIFDGIDLVGNVGAHRDFLQKRESHHGGTEGTE